MRATDADISLANRLADAAASVILPRFRLPIAVENKLEGFFDPVTEADKGAERAIRAVLAAEAPNDAILGEEYGAQPGTSGRRWILDPLDGTRSFIIGSPLWGTLIALESGGDIALGLLDQPFLRERFIGVRGQTTLTDSNGTRTLQTRACETLARAVIATTHPLAHFNDADRARFTNVERACRLSRYGGDCYLYALLALGQVDLVIEADLKEWDIAALRPIVEGAGGIVTGWNGEAITTGGNVVAAGDPRIHAGALKLLA